MEALAFGVVAGCALLSALAVVRSADWYVRCSGWA